MNPWLSPNLCGFIAVEAPCIFFNEQNCQMWLVSLSMQGVVISYNIISFVRLAHASQ